MDAIDSASSAVQSDQGWQIVCISGVGKLRYDRPYECFSPLLILAVALRYTGDND